jgi:AraC-like DNA-binding protein
MRFVPHRPLDPLSRFVDYLWYAEADESLSYQGSQFPTGGVYVLFNLGLPQGLRGEGEEVSWYQTSWVSGERVHPLHLVSPNGARLLGVHFHPGGAHPFFRLPLDELTEQVLSLDQFWPEAESLRERLALEPSTCGRFQVLEAALLERLAEPRADGNLFVTAVLKTLQDRSPRASIRRAAAEVGVSQRHLRRTFKEKVGLGPKALHRVLRFQSVIRALDAGTTHQWSALAVRAGYYDQAHLISDFRDFTGITPGQYLAQRSPDPNFAMSDEGL